jgi:AcrR family transcriptional regulator
MQEIDPRIRRARLLLQQALEKLLEKEDFERISVQDIAEIATVNRVTCYDHYTDNCPCWSAWPEAASRNC